MNGWQDMDSAPKTGGEILVRRDNGCQKEHAVVWWGGGLTYPWQSDSNAYTADRWDEWRKIPI